jgi:hydroxymethylglutaryl-CoA lyase
MEPVEIVEVGARDGLQNEKTLVSTDDKLALIRRCIAAGARRLEIASFVNPRRVPQMADAEAVVAGLGRPEGISRIGLTLNRRGAERALAAGVDELGAVAIATDGFGIANQAQTSDDSVAEASAIIALARASGASAQVTISVAFGCPFEGRVDPARVVAMAAQLAAAGPREIALADTIGVAVPGQVTALVAAVRAVVGAIPLRLHFHNTRNTGIANAWAGYQAGVRIFDSSLAGLGGCPFAPNATGNVATEDLAYLFAESGVATGLDLDALIMGARWLSTDIMARPLPGMVGRAGAFPKVGAG